MINFIHKILEDKHSSLSRWTHFSHIAVAGTETKPWIEFHPKPPAHSESLHRLFPLLAFHFSSAHLSPITLYTALRHLRFSQQKIENIHFISFSPALSVGAEFFLYFSAFFFGTSKKVFPASQWKIQLSASVWKWKRNSFHPEILQPRLFMVKFASFNDNVLA